MTTKTAVWLDHAAESWYGGDYPGPTGRHVRVLAGEVQDYGGNVLFAGSADECQKYTCRIPTRLVPTRWEAVAGDVVGAENNSWELVIV